MARGRGNVRDVAQTRLLLTRGAGKGRMRVATEQSKVEVERTLIARARRKTPRPLRVRDRFARKEKCV